MAKKNNGKYDSGVNIMGSVPNYNAMLDYISDTYGNTKGSTGAFEFRTEKSLQRFISAIESCILKFRNDTHKMMFFDAIADNTFSAQERLVILFWQLTYSNLLFSRITAEVFMKAVYSGRVTIMAEEITSFLRFIKETEEGELNWSDDTIKISGKTYKVTAISSDAFKGNKKLKKITLGKNVSQIPAKAFYKQRKLKTLTILSTKINKIGSSAFAGCDKLTTFTLKSKKLSKKSVKNSLKGSKLKSIKTTSSLKKKYKKLFTKKNAGRKVKIK